MTIYGSPGQFASDILNGSSEQAKEESRWT
jgi:hypothetical protein